MVGYALLIVFGLWTVFVLSVGLVKEIVEEDTPRWFSLIVYAPILVFAVVSIDVMAHQIGG